MCPRLGQGKLPAAIREHRLSHLQSLGDTGTTRVLQHPKVNAPSSELVQTWDCVPGLLIQSLPKRQNPHAGASAAATASGTAVSCRCFVVHQQGQKANEIKVCSG